MQNQRDIIGAIITLARLIKTEADKRARAHGMTRAQWAILINLERQPGLLQKELAELLEVEPITVARLIDRLEARGMVERRADPGDRRCWRLHLTDASRPLMGEIGGHLGELAAICLDGVDDRATDIFRDVLSRMRDAMAAEARKSPTPQIMQDADP